MSRVFFAYVEGSDLEDLEDILAHGKQAEPAIGRLLPLGRQRAGGVPARLRREPAEVAVVRLAADRGSYPMETITASASLTTSATLLLVAAVVGVALIVRGRRWPLLALVGGGAIAAAPTFTIGFIGNRYLVDMLPMLLVPAALAFGTFQLPVAMPALCRKRLKSGICNRNTSRIWFSMAQVRLCLSGCKSMPLWGNQPRTHLKAAWCN